MIAFGQLNEEGEQVNAFEMFSSVHFNSFAIIIIDRTLNDWSERCD